MKHKKEITNLIVFGTIVSLLVTTVFFGIGNNIVKADASSSLDFDPSETSVAINSDFTITARIFPNGNEVNSVRASIEYDETKLSLSDATCSSSFSWESTAFSVPSPQDGTASITCTLGNPATDPPVTEVSSVATFSFHSLASNVTDSFISFADGSHVWADESEDPDENVLLMSTIATVTINTELTAIGAISGTTRVGETLTAGALTPSGATVNYQWQRADSADGSYTNINGATANTYSLTSDDQNKFIKVVATGAGSYTGSVTSVATSAVSGENSSSSSSHKNKKKSTPKRYISQSKKSISRGATLVQRGKKFTKNGAVLLYFSKPGGGYYAPMKIKADKTGKFSVKYVVTKPKGSYSWYAFDVKTNKKSKIKTYKVK